MDPPQLSSSLSLEPRSLRRPKKPPPPLDSASETAATPSSRRRTAAGRPSSVASSRASSVEPGDVARDSSSQSQPPSKRQRIGAAAPSTGTRRSSRISQMHSAAHSDEGGHEAAPKTPSRRGRNNEHSHHDDEEEKENLPELPSSPWTRKMQDLITSITSLSPAKLFFSPQKVRIHNDGEGMPLELEEEAGDASASGLEHASYERELEQPIEGAADAASAGVGHDLDDDEEIEDFVTTMDVTINEIELADDDEEVDYNVDDQPAAPMQPEGFWANLMDNRLAHLLADVFKPVVQALFIVLSLPYLLIVSPFVSLFHHLQRPENVNFVRALLFLLLATIVSLVAHRVHSSGLDLRSKLIVPESIVSAFQSVRDAPSHLGAAVAPYTESLADSAQKSYESAAETLSQTSMRLVESVNQAIDVMSRPSSWSVFPNGAKDSERSKRSTIFTFSLPQISLPTIAIPSWWSWSALPQKDWTVHHAAPIADLTPRLKALEASLTSLRAQMVADNSALSKSVSSNLANVANTITALRSRLDVLDASVADSNKLLAKKDDVEALRQGLSGVLAALGDLRDRVTEVESGEGWRKEFETAVVDRVKALLPSLMVGRLDQVTGEVVLAPEFFQYLEERFVKPLEVEELRTKVLKDVKALFTETEERSLKESDVERIVAAHSTGVDETLVRSIIDDALKSTGSKGGNIRKIVDDNVAQASKAAEDKLQDLRNQFQFLRANQDKIESMLRGDEEGNGVILSRAEVVELIAARVNELQSSIAVPPAPPTADGAGFKATDIDKYVVPLVKRLIDDGIRRHKADGIGRADHALAYAGAIVIPALTSRTFTKPAGGLVSLVFGAEAPVGGGPVFALTPGTLPGQCWAMKGASGQIGIRLAAGSTVPTAFTIDHVPSSLTTQPSGEAHQSAPRDVELWAVLDERDFKEMDLDDPSHRLPPRTAVKTPPAGVLLASGRFDPGSDDGVVTFGVPEDTRIALSALLKDQGRVAVVVLRILSNWGNPKYTCLYRVRVHGR